MEFGDIFRKKFGVNPSKLDINEINNIALGNGVCDKKLENYRKELDDKIDKVLENKLI